MASDTAIPKTRPPVDLSVVLFLLGMVVIGSTTAASVKLSVRELPIPFLPVARFGLASLVLVPMVARNGRFARLLRENPARILLASALCVPVNQMFLMAGTRRAPTTHVGLIYATCPLVVILLAWILGQERLDTRRLVGILASVAGAGVIAASNLWNTAPASAGVLAGDLLLVGAVGSWGAYLTVNKPLVARYGSLTVLAATFLLGSLLALPILLLALPGRAAFQGVSPTAWLALGHLAFIVTVGGLACQNQALARLDASQVATVGNAAPLLTVLWGVILLGESITPALVVGGLLILGGILWATAPGRARTRPRAADSETARTTATPLSPATSIALWPH